MATAPTSRRRPLGRSSSAEKSAGGPKPTRQEKKERTRALLIDAGVNLVRERGLFGSSLDAIAEAAGLTKGAIYSNFGSKAEFFYELLERIFGEQIVTAGPDQPELVATEFINHLGTHPEYWARMLEVSAYVIEDPELREVMVRGRRAAGGLPELTGPGDPGWHAVAVEAAAGGIAMLRLLYGTALTPDDLIRWIFARLARS